nr:undecaprenyl-phosphate glucose phosphotransferase [Chloroflexaceae bacterium]
MAVISSAPQPRVASAKRTRSHSRLWRFAFLFTLLLGDLLAMNAAFMGVYLWRLPEIEDSGLLLPDVRSIAFFLLALNLIFLLSCIFGRMYDMRRGVSRVDEASRMFVVIALTTVLALIVNTLLPQLGFDDLPWTGTILALSLLATLAATTLLRSIHRSIVVRLRRMGIDVRRVLIVGAREPGRAVWSTIRRMPELGYQVQGFLSDSFEVGSTIDDLPVLGRTMQLGRVVRATRADEIIIALSGRSQSDLLEIVALAEDESVAIKVYPDTFQLITNNDISVGDLSGLPLVSVKNAALDSAFNQ